MPGLPTQEQVMSGIFSRIKIGPKIYAGFALVLLLLLGTSASNWFKLDSISQNIVGLDQLARRTTAVNLIQESVLLIRQKARDFVVGSPAAIKDEPVVYADGIKRIQDAMPLFSTNEAALLKGVGDTFSEYHAYFNDFAKLDAQRQLLIANSLRPEAAKIDETLQKIAQSENSAGDGADTYLAGVAAAGLANARAAAESYVAQRYVAVADDQALQAFHAAETATAKSAAALAPKVKDEALHAAAAALPGAIADYGKTLDQIVAVMKDRDAKIHEALYGSLGPKMQNVIIKFNGELQKDQRSVGDQSLSFIASTRTTTLIVTGIALAFGVVASLLLARTISHALTALSGTMTRLAGGDLSLAVPFVRTGDEVGEMARSVEVFKENMLKTKQLTDEQDTMKARNEAEKRAAMVKIADEFERSVRSVVDAVAAAATQMQSTAQSMSVSAEETQRQAGTVASASEQTSANVQTVASSAEEMTSSISEISRQVTQASQIAKQAVEDAQRTNRTVNTLAEAAQKIGQVVQLIQDIASQTNLLALNATIEAARAGEAGKGFAVVASEVKSLANQTAKATEEIAAQIGSIQTVTGEAVTAIQGIGGTIGHINEISTAIASAVEEQGAATQEIARNTQEAAKGTEQVSSNIAGVNRAAGETGSAASQVLASAEQLGRQSETLRTDVNRFLEKIRAA
jgi:methyl-accepting chemotaxis protein